MVVKRSTADGYADLDNDLFYMDKTMMVFATQRKLWRIWLRRYNPVDPRRPTITLASSWQMKKRHPS
jgi:hypothetical protein